MESATFRKWLAADAVSTMGAKNGRMGRRRWSSIAKGIRPKYLSVVLTKRLTLALCAGFARNLDLIGPSCPGLRAALKGASRLAAAEDRPYRQRPKSAPDRNHVEERLNIEGEVSAVLRSGPRRAQFSRSSDSDRSMQPLPRPMQEGADSLSGQRRVDWCRRAFVRPTGDGP